MADRYAVIGNPIAHSKSPLIHAAFARQTGQDLSYERVLGRLDDFERQVAELASSGFRGLNVTLPFKERALALAGSASERACLAGAANTLTLAADGIHADNTDGVGLLRDLRLRLGREPAGRRVLVLGAGGAVCGILAPLLACGPAVVDVCNRTEARATAVVDRFSGLAPPAVLRVLRSELLASETAYDIVLNGTAAGLSEDSSALPASLFGVHTTAYDLAYRADAETPFVRLARACGAAVAVDGLGMLVEQAAESFALWRGCRPDTEPVLAALRGLPASGP